MWTSCQELSRAGNLCFWLTASMSGNRWSSSSCIQLTGKMMIHRDKSGDFRVFPDFLEKLQPNNPFLNLYLWRSLAAMDQTRRQAPPTTSTRVPSKSILSHSPMFNWLKFPMPKFCIYILFPGGEATAITSNLQPAVQPSTVWRPWPGIPTRHSWWNVALWALHGKTELSDVRWKWCPNPFTWNG